MQAARPTQWVKNLATFAAIFFTGNLTDESKLVAVSLTFLSFCLAASSTYLFNDLVDISSDILHSSKRSRPLAAKKISANLALAVCAVLALFALLVSFLVAYEVFLVVLLYLSLQIAYSLYLKKVILLELLVIAFGFMLRVFAGSFAAQVALSSWLILSVMMLSLFLAVGKRRSETTLLGNLAASHRSTLASYPINLLDGLVFLSATSSLITYSLFTFNEPRSSSSLLIDILPSTISSSKWLMVTIPAVVYGIFRYLYLIFEKREGESPEKILLQDKPLLATIIVWLILCTSIIYLLPTI